MIKQMVAEQDHQLKKHQKPSRSRGREMNQHRLDFGSLRCPHMPYVRLTKTAQLCKIPDRSGTLFKMATFGRFYTIMWCSVHKLLCSALKLSAPFRWLPISLHIIFRDLWADVNHSISVPYFTSVLSCKAIDKSYTRPQKTIVDALPSYSWICCTLSRITDHWLMSSVDGVWCSSLTCSWPSIVAHLI